MRYVIYHKATTYYLDYKNKSYATEAVAKAALTRAAKSNPDLEKHMFGFATTGDFRDIEKMVAKQNMMSKKWYLERVNTPHYCSPASESYWSM